jgi:hypothetical protein
MKIKGDSAERNGLGRSTPKAANQMLTPQGWLSRSHQAFLNVGQPFLADALSLAW